MKDALKLAIDRLEWFIDAYPHDIAVGKEEFMRPFKAALAQDEPWCMKTYGCKTKCEDCPVEVVEQEPVNAWQIFGEDNQPLVVSSDWFTTKKYKAAGRRVEQLAYYTTPPQPEERNFCPRCGKRTADLTVIHTCTPPQERT